MVFCESTSFPGWEGRGSSWPGTVAKSADGGGGQGLILGSPTLICKVLGESTLSQKPELGYGRGWGELGGAEGEGLGWVASSVWAIWEQTATYLELETVGGKALLQRPRPWQGRKEEWARDQGCRVDNREALKKNQKGW